MKEVKLSVNINKIALIRNSRGADLPNLLIMACDLEAWGADGITIHPRPDQRHIRYEDVPILKEGIKTELNIEGYPTDDFVQLVLECKPAQVTLVPDLPGALTSDHGWKISDFKDFLSTIIPLFQNSGIRVSLFVDDDPEVVRQAADIGVDRIELFTGPYAHQYNINRSLAIQNHIECSKVAHQCGLGVNAGHDLNLMNLAYYVSHLDYLDEVSIGHALICDALYLGYSNAVAMYLARIKHPEIFL